MGLVTMEAMVAQVEHLISLVIYMLAAVEAAVVAATKEPFHLSQVEVAVGQQVTDL